MPCYSLGYGVSELSDLVPVQTQHFEDVERSFEVALRNPPNQKLNPGFRIYCSERVLENFVFLVFKGLGLVDCTHP